MITLMRRVVLDVETERLINRRFAAHFNMLEQGLCFKLRKARPCCIANVSYDVEVSIVSFAGENAVSLGLALCICGSDQLVGMHARYRAFAMRAKTRCLSGWHSLFASSLVAVESDCRHARSPAGFCLPPMQLSEELEDAVQLSLSGVVLGLRPAVTGTSISHD